MTRALRLKESEFSDRVSGSAQLFHMRVPHWLEIFAVFHHALGRLYNPL